MFLEGPDHCGCFHSWAGVPGLYNRKQAEQDMKSMLIRIPPWPLLQISPPGFCLAFLLWNPFSENCKLYCEINLSLPKILLVMVLITVIESKLPCCLTQRCPVAYIFPTNIVILFFLSSWIKFNFVYIRHILYLSTCWFIYRLVSFPSIFE